MRETKDYHLNGRGPEQVGEESRAKLLSLRVILLSIPKAIIFLIVSHVSISLGELGYKRLIVHFV
jgi:hypothetical protein